MSDCVFCKIASGEIPVNKVYENDDVLAFLDANPQSKGHILVIPKKHSENIFEIDDDDLEEVIDVVQKVAVRIKEKLEPQGMNIKQNNGEIAGQTVNHFHFHIIPRYEVNEDYDKEEICKLIAID